MRKLISNIFFSSSAIVAFSQNAVPVLLTPLPLGISESSGVETDSVSGIIWTHNDSGGLPEIYKVDTSGNLLRTIYLSGVTAIDFEDITRDETGNVYVGDFGDNTIMRTDLMIYKIQSPESFFNDTILPEVISFSYSTTGQAFDCEAFFHFNQSLFLFTKSHPSGEYTKLFRLPDSAGAYTPTLVDSFYFISPITGADISSDGNTVALLSYGKISLLRAFTGNNFFSGTISSFNIPLSQTEGLAFISNTELYITDEKYFGIGGNLYLLDLAPLMSESETKPIGEGLTIYPNPSEGKFTIEFPSSNFAFRPSIQISNVFGELILKSETRLPDGQVSNLKSEIDLSRNPAGIYFIEMYNNDIILSGKILIQ